jgi:hypothetical protein
VTEAPAAEPSLAEKETARALFEEGDEKFRAGDYAGALEAFTAADAIMGVPTTGLELGRAQSALGMLLEARDTLVRVTLIPRQPDENEYFVQARSEAATLAREIGERIPSVAIRVAPPEVEARIVIDGSPIARALARHAIRVNPGKRVIRVEAAGHLPATREIELRERDRRVLDVALAPEPGPREQPAGPADRPSSDDLVTVAWVAFGVGAAGLVAAGVTGGMALAAEADLSERCPGKVCAAEDAADLDRAKALGNGATASAVIGSMGIALGIATLIIDLTWPADDGAGVQLGPTGLQARF